MSTPGCYDLLLCGCAISSEYEVVLFSHPRWFLRHRIYIHWNWLTQNWLRHRQFRTWDTFAFAHSSWWRAILLLTLGVRLGQCCSLVVPASVILLWVCCRCTPPPSGELSSLPLSNSLHPHLSPFLQICTTFVKRFHLDIVWSWAFEWFAFVRVSPSGPQILLLACRDFPCCVSQARRCKVFWVAAEMLDPCAPPGNKL